MLWHQTTSRPALTPSGVSITVCIAAGRNRILILIVMWSTSFTLPKLFSHEFVCSKYNIPTSDWHLKSIVNYSRYPQWHTPIVTSFDVALRRDTSSKRSQPHVHAPTHSLRLSLPLSTHRYRRISETLDTRFTLFCRQNVKRFTEAHSHSLKHQQTFTLA